MNWEFKPGAGGSDLPSDVEPGEPELLEAFAAKHAATLARLEAEAAALETAPFRLGHIAIVCALGYLDFRFAGMDWRSVHPRLGAWFDAQSRRPSVQNTVPVDD